MQPDDLDIQIINESVTISGKLKRERSESGQFLLAECPSGTFHRIITLPTSLDSNKVEAELNDGVLTVQIPKAKEAKPRLIKIKQK